MLRTATTGDAAGSCRAAAAPVPRARPGVAGGEDGAGEEDPAGAGGADVAGGTARAVAPGPAAGAGRCFPNSQRRSDPPGYQNDRDGDEGGGPRPQGTGPGRGTPE